jgi:redox-sensing transcriptional repressor
MRYHKIPDETVRRLPVYLRGLQGLSLQGTQNISSRKLAELLGFNPWQIRKDLSYFGGFGTRGVGYSIDKLIKQIKKILRIDSQRQTALIGVGSLGSAILKYEGFAQYGFDIKAAFDIDSKKIGKVINGIRIKDTKNISELKKHNINIAILAVPAQAAQTATDNLVNAGVKGILNFSPQRVKVPKKVKVITIDIAMDLARLPYYMPGS